MYGYVTVLIEGIAAGLFALTAALYLGVFKKNRLRVITGIILAVYAAYLVKDIVYLLPYVASNDYIYKVLLSVDNWAVPLYVVYAFEVISPGRITIPKVLLLFFPFVGMTVLYAAWPYDWMFSLQVLFASVFSAVCMCVMLRMTIKYRRRLLDNCSDITHMDIRWMWVSIALFLPNLVLWIFLSVRQLGHSGLPYLLFCASDRPGHLGGSAAFLGRIMEFCPEAQRTGFERLFYPLSSSDPLGTGGGAGDQQDHALQLSQPGGGHYILRLHQLSPGLRG